MNHIEINYVFSYFEAFSPEIDKPLLFLFQNAENYPESNLMLTTLNQGKSGGKVLIVGNPFLGGGANQWNGTNIS